MDPNGKYMNIYFYSLPQRDKMENIHMPKTVLRPEK
jgi:hypothetical protein